MNSLYYKNIDELRKAIINDEIALIDIDKTNIFLAAQAKADIKTEETTFSESELVLRKAYAIVKIEKNGSYIGNDLLLNDIFTGGVEKNRRVDIVIGLPYGGKSSALVHPLSHKHHSRIVDGEMVKEKLYGYDNGFGDSAVLEESEAILKDYQEVCMERGDNIVLSIVGSDKEKVLNTIKLFKKNGYDVYLHLNEVKNDTAIKRVILRFIKVGCYINLNIIRACKNYPSRVYEVFKNNELVSGYSKLNNDEKKLVLIEECDKKEFSSTETIINKEKVIKRKSNSNIIVELQGKVNSIQNEKNNLKINLDVQNIVLNKKITTNFTFEIKDKNKINKINKLGLIPESFINIIGSLILDTNDMHMVIKRIDKVNSTSYINKVTIKGFIHERQIINNEPQISIKCKSNNNPQVSYEKCYLKENIYVSRKITYEEQSKGDYVEITARLTNDNHFLDLEARECRLIRKAKELSTSFPKNENTNTTKKDKSEHERD